MMGGLLGAMANKGSHTDPMAMAAMMNGNQWMNNPFIYLVFLMMSGNGGWFGNRNGNQVQDAEIQAKLNQLSTQMQDGNNTSLLMDAVKGNNVALQTLGSTLNCDFNQHWQSDLQQRYNDARLELSQQRQNAELIAALKTTTTTTTT